MYIPDVHRESVLFFVVLRRRITSHLCSYLRLFYFEGSNHYGICSWYTDLAVKCGMLVSWYYPAQNLLFRSLIVYCYYVSVKLVS